MKQGISYDKVNHSYIFIILKAKGMTFHMKILVEKENINQKKLSILCFSLFSGWLLSFPFEGKILSMIMEKQNIAGMQYGIISVIVHFLGLFISGFFVNKYFTSKKTMLFSTMICILGSLIFFFSFSSFWYISLVIISLFSGVFIATWGIHFKVFFTRKERLKTAASVLIYSNIIMILLNIISVNLSPYIALFVSLISLCITIILFLRIEDFSDEKFYNQLNKNSNENNNTEILRPFILLCLFILIISIISGLMYNVVSPDFSDYEFLLNYYWVAPYILAIIILRSLKDRANRDYILYIGLAMIGISYIFFMWTQKSPISYFIINTFMMGAFGIYDLFFWSVLGSFLDHYDNPVKILGIGLSMNVLGISIGGLIGNLKVLSQGKNDKVSSIVFVIIFMVIIILPFLNKLLSKVFKYNQIPIESKELDKNKPDSYILDLKDKFCLTDREIEIVELLLKGYTYKAVSENLYISENTVKYHIKNIYQKMNINSKMELIRMFKED